MIEVEDIARIHREAKLRELWRAAEAEQKWLTEKRRKDKEANRAKGEAPNERKQSR